MQLKSGQSVERQVLGRRKNRRRRAPWCPPIQIQFICFVAIYFIGSLFVIIYCMASLPLLGSTIEPEPLSFHPDWHPKTRSERFPSIERRLEIYTGHFGRRPCTDADKVLYSEIKSPTNYTVVRVGTGRWTFVDFPTIIRRNTFIHVDESILSDCARKPWQLLIRRTFLFYRDLGNIDDRRNNRGLCGDLSDMLKEAALGAKVPILATLNNPASSNETQLGSTIPFFAPARPIIRSGDLSSAASGKCISRSISYPQSPILWPLDTQSQFYWMRVAQRRDSKWSSKSTKAVWRSMFPTTTTPATPELCQADEMCRVLTQCQSSSVVDAGYGGRGAPEGMRNMVKVRLGLRSMQQAKLLIHFEQEDDFGVSLAWKLYSKSAVLMSPPTKTTWLMEELLEPWVHYIPLLADETVESKVEWVKEHDVEAHKIAERASLYIHDLMLHDVSEEENDSIRRTIVAKYTAHW